MILNSDIITIIDSIPIGELQTARHLYEHICDIRSGVDSPTWTVERRRIESGSELITLLAGLGEQSAKSERYPIVHLECHGSTDGITLASGEFVPWNILAPELRKINRATRNSLVVVWAACEGFHSIKCIVGAITEGTPIRVVVGPEQPVMAGVLEDAMKAFYSSVLVAQDIDAACAASRKIEQSMKLYKAEDAFVSAYRRYLELEAESAKSKRDQVEDLVSMAKADPNLRDVPRLHKVVKEAFKMAGPEHMLGHLKNNFFMLDEFPEVAEQVQHITLELIRGNASGT